MVEFTERDDVERWLTERMEAGAPQDWAVTLAARSALRALPGLGSEPPGTFGGIALVSFRATLTSAVAATCPTAEVEEAAYAADASDYADASHYADAADLAYAAYASAASGAASAYGADAAFAALSKDADILEAEGVAAVFAAPLWHGGEPPEIFTERRGGLEERVTSDPATWDFWRRWYDGMERGAPMPWDLQQAVALIPNADWRLAPENEDRDTWDKVAAHVAGLIRESEARFQLNARIAELEAELVQASANRLGIGGNHPPEPIDEPDLSPVALEIIWAPLQDLKTEVEATKPDKSRVRGLIAALLEALKAGWAWMASKADLAVDTTIKWGIPAVGGGYIALNPDKLQAVIDSAQSWLSLLP